MTIKEVSEHFGISQDTLRYYERVKMIPKVTRTSGGIRGLSGRGFEMGGTGSLHEECRFTD